jgi:hypothetical protein
MIKWKQPTKAYSRPCSSVFRNGPRIHEHVPWFQMDGNDWKHGHIGVFKTLFFSIPQWAKRVSSCPPCWLLLILFTPLAESVWDLRTGTCSQMHSRICPGARKVPSTIYCIIDSKNSPPIKITGPWQGPRGFFHPALYTNVILSTSSASCQEIDQLELTLSDR